MCVESFRSLRPFDDVLVEAMAATEARVRDDPLAKAAAVLLLVPMLGPDPIVLAQYSGYGAGFIAPLLARLRQAAIVRDEGLSHAAEIEWQRCGHVALKVHALVSLGLLKRETRDGAHVYDVTGELFANAAGDGTGAAAADPRYQDVT
jgi:hypothetical protein